MKPSGGTATINGKDVTSNMDEIRKDIGLCPQHNILFDSLTVEEHLYFFAKVLIINFLKLHGMVQTMDLTNCFYYQILKC